MKIHININTLPLKKVDQNESEENDSNNNTIAVEDGSMNLI